MLLTTLGKGMRKARARLRALVLMRCGLTLTALALVAAAAPAQSRPESAASRPARKLTVRQVPLPISGQEAVPASCSFSPNGRFLTVVRAGSLPRIYDFETKRLAVAPDGNPNWPPAFDPKSELVAITVERGIAFHRFHSGEWRHEKTVRLPVNPWIVFPNPRTLPWSKDGTSMLYVEWAEVHRIGWPSGEVRKLELGKGEPRGAVFLGSAFGVALGDERGFETVIVGDDGVKERLPEVRVLAASADHRSWLVARLGPASAAESKAERRPSLEIWDAASRRPRARLTLPPDQFSLSTGVCHAAFSANGDVLVTGDFRTVGVRDGRTGEVLHTIRHYETDRVVACALSPDGWRLFTMGRLIPNEANGLVLWELSFE